ncbi:transposable element Tc1 transposase [Trichonephila clavipes]|nr:transposable element Tc1 transposase [Trichonephila clavipes]
MEENQGSANYPPNVYEIHNNGGGGLMVWAGIMLDDRTPFHVFERGSLTSVRALLVDEFLESGDIRRMDWPAKSPDFNHIEHFWVALERAIATHNPPPKTLQETVLRTIRREHCNC